MQLVISPWQTSWQLKLAGYKFARPVLVVSKWQRVKLDRAFNSLRFAIDMIIDRPAAERRWKRNRQRPQHSIPRHMNRLDSAQAPLVPPRLQDPARFARL